MTLTTQLQYNIRDLNGTLIPNKSISVSLKINELTPKYLLHKAIVIQDRNRRQGTASCKTRSEVRGGGKKPWKQKGTGRARSGSSNSPLWNGGGVTFGPKPRDYEKNLIVKKNNLRSLQLFTIVFLKQLLLKIRFKLQINLALKLF